MSQQPLETIIPDVATKIKEMTYLKQTYLKFIIDLFPFLKDPIKQVYANQLILLLQNLINIHKNEILFELEDALTSVLISYIFDMDAIVKNQLDFEKYEQRHQNLVTINQQTNYYIKHNDPYGLSELQEKMFMI
jgi:hypothetical protein